MSHIADADLELTALLDLRSQLAAIEAQIETDAPTYGTRIRAELADLRATIGAAIHDHLDQGAIHIARQTLDEAERRAEREAA